MDDSWTLSELVAEAATRIEALPAPKNGQVRAVPDERTIRYYGSIGLLDRPSAMRGRTALYGKKHLAQVVAIKRMQTSGKSLAEITAVWPTLDLASLARMSGVALDLKGAGRKEFWKREPAPQPAPIEAPKLQPALAVSQPIVPHNIVQPSLNPTWSPLELRLEIAPGVVVSIALPEDAPVSISPAEIRAFRAASAPLVTELAKRGLTAHDLGTLEEKP